MNRRRAASGFTAIELLVSIVVLGIIVALSANSFINLIASARMNSEITYLLGAINQARSEAIKRGYNVSVCAVANPSNATTACDGASTDWSSGWVMLASSTTPQLLLISPGVTHGDTLTSTTVNSYTYPVFTQTGYTYYSGTITLHDSNSTPGLYKCIVFNAGTWAMQTGAACP